MMQGTYICLVVHHSGITVWLLTLGLFYEVAIGRTVRHIAH
jgi:hypothetical protein